MSSSDKDTADGYDLVEYWSVLWSSKWLICAITAVFAVSSVVYSLLATEWYQTEVILAPADRRTGQSSLGQLSGLANLAGVSIGQGGNQEAIAVLRSRAYAREFIEKNGLTAVLLSQGAEPEQPMDVREAFRVFDNLVRAVEFDRKTGLVTMTFRWTDPNTVAKWANDYVRGVNDRMRAQALRDSEQNLAFLYKEMSSTAVVSLQQSIGRVLESEMQKLMLAKGNEEFAFKVIDPAFVPDRRVSPKRTLTVIIATMAGGFFAVLWVLLRRTVARRDLK